MPCFLQYVTSSNASVIIWTLTVHYSHTDCSYQNCSTELVRLLIYLSAITDTAGCQFPGKVWARCSSLSSHHLLQKLFIDLCCFPVAHAGHRNHKVMCNHEKLSPLPQPISLQHLDVSNCCYWYSQSLCQSTFMHLILPGCQRLRPKSKEGPI